ncbi:hypothetical protein CL630_02235 [bacterium]|nr:hypothetical protein [bacterium]|tara:strand:+ start:161 stop:502 length:342 start_codon:yes stop_codon:yes gene_type:complete
MISNRNSVVEALKRATKCQVFVSVTSDDIGHSVDRFDGHLSNLVARLRGICQPTIERPHGFYSDANLSTEKYWFTFRRDEQGVVWTEKVDEIIRLLDETPLSITRNHHFGHLF